MGSLGGIELFFFFVVPALYVGSMVWAFYDAEKQGRNGLLAAILVGVMFWPAGLVVWLIVRRAGRRQSDAG